jgi:Putative Flp pilus-assembly TadE/G-like
LRKVLRSVGGERGTVVVVMTLALTGLLGFMAFAVDLGHAYYVKRSLQAAADSAALSGAQELPANSAEAVARAYSSSNGKKNARANVPGVVTDVSLLCRDGSPCQPVNAVEVVQTVSVATDFARVLGFESFTVRARAVAQIKAGDTPWAIFAYDTGCGSIGLKQNGNVFEVDGGIHSNGSFSVNGLNITAGYASSGGPNECDPVIDGKHIDFGGEARPVFDPEKLEWPRPYDEDDITCTYRAKKFTFNDHNATIPAGVYCAEETFEANANHLKGNITVLAPEIKADGNNMQLTPYVDDLLFFATGTKEMVLNGNSYDWTGVIFHPRGRVKINGNADSSLTGLIEGLEVEVNGNAFRMTGTGPKTAGRSIELVE